MPVRCNNSPMPPRTIVVIITIGRRGKIDPNYIPEHVDHFGLLLLPPSVLRPLLLKIGAGPQWLIKLLQYLQQQKCPLRKEENAISLLLSFPLPSLVPIRLF